ncbi:hypothetical protein [Endozoicomonas sp. ONNA1]|uniref:hypothetical protein n=1 Tax=Endozoicomonas sp. ONNA1 TaxID=2828740 RepID=UPI002148B508|nr:hypothetical protein [Endozoicomonas sp. ONNA1]
MSNNYQNRNTNQKKKTLLDDNKLKLYAPKLDGGTGSPSFSVSKFDNNIHFVVYTNLPNDKERGKIDARFDMIQTMGVLTKFNELIRSEKPGTVVLKYLDHTFFNRKRSDEVRHLSSLIFEKEDSGKIYVAITARDRPQIKFYFATNKHAALAKRDRTEFTEAEDSQFQASGWCALMKRLIPSILVDDFTMTGQDHYKARKEKREQSGGQYNNNSQSQSSSGGEEFNDVIPY